ncbi:MAG: dehydrogenase, partial [Thermoanaerobaculia bacterium]
MELPDSYRAACLLGPEEIEIRQLTLPRPQSGELVLRVDVATTCGTDLKVFRQGGHPRMLQV